MEYYIVVVLVMALMGAAIGMNTGLLALFVALTIFFALTRWLKWQYAALRLTPIVPIDHMFGALFLSACAGFIVKMTFFA